MSARAFEDTPQSESAPTGQRVQFAHHQIKVHGARVGVSVGGAGVPLVFFHGIGMNRHAYMRLLNRLPQLGFMVIAIDAPGHGDTVAPRRWERSFDHHIGTASEILNELGVRRAVLVGHSMGGRTVAGLAAREPHRALAAVLIDPALGSTFDAAARRAKSPVQTLSGLTAGLADFFFDRVGLRHLDHVRHTSLVGRTALRALFRPDLFFTTARSIVLSPPSVGALSALASAGVPVVVVHGERDMIVPFASAVETALASNATLVSLPRAYHSWVLSTPWTFAEIMRRLLSEGLLGDQLPAALAAQKAGSCNTAVFYTASAPALGLAPPIRVLGDAAPAGRRLFHDFTVWEADAVARHAQRLTTVHGRE